MGRTSMLSLVAVVAATMVAPSGSVGIATISIDFGNEWIKVGLVKPGVPMDIVLNTETKRKTTSFIGLRDNERTFSASAENVATKYPQFAFGYMFELLGEKVGSAAVTKYAERFPHHKIVAAEDRGTVAFELGDVTYMVEELLAQLVEHAVTLSEITAEQDISSVVFTVPPYFTQAQRKALLLVGEIAKVKVLQLINSPTAVAINYGVFRTKEFNETARNVIFYDMGATSTIATVVSYQLTSDKKSKSKEKYPELAVKGTGYDRTLGGVEFTYRLRQQLLEEFLKNKKVKGDVAGHPRAMAKLFAAAEKTKKILSANKETQTRVEGLYDEIDFKAQVSREMFEDVSADLFKRVTAPIDRALEMAKMSIDDIDELIIFGGGLRIPKVQELLKEKMGVEQLGKSINGDEAACLGASYRSAALSKAFRLKKFSVKDTSLFPVALQYEKPIFEEQDDNAGEAGEDGEAAAPEPPKVKEYKPTTVTMFQKNNQLPQKKVFRFKNLTSDFAFSLAYGNTSFLPESEQAFVTPPDLAEINLHNVSDAFVGHESDEPQGIKVTLALDKNGIVTVEKAYAEFKREPEPEPEPEKGVLDSVADGLRGLFGGDDDEKKAEADSAADSGKPAAGDDTKADADADADADTNMKPEADIGGDSDKTADTDADADADAEKKPDADADADDADATDKKTADADADADADASADADAEAGDKVEEPKKKKEKKKPPPPKPKPTVFKPAIALTSEVKDIAGMTEEEYTAATSRIAALVKIETDKRAREAAYNDLESYIYKTRADLEEQFLLDVTNETQRDAMSSEISASSLWLEDDGWDANTTVLLEKKAALEEVLGDAYGRAAEAATRPGAIKDLKAALNSTLELLRRVKKMNAESIAKNTTQWISNKTYDDLETVYNETKEWFEKKKKAQKKVADHEAPVLKTAVMTQKTQKLNREAMYVAKTPKPRPPKKPKAKKNKTKAENITIDAGEGETVAEDAGAGAGAGADGSTADDAAADDAAADDAAADGAAADDAAADDAAADDTTESPPLDEPPATDEPAADDAEKDPADL